MSCHRLWASVAAVAALISPTPADVPVGYGIYSSEETVIGERADFAGGRIGSSGNIRIGIQAQVIGSVEAAGSISVFDRAKIYGDAKAAGTVTLSSGAQVNGTVTQRATVARYTIDAKTVTAGTQNITVANDQSLTLAAGSYGDVVVGDRAKLFLNPGIYNFRSLLVKNDARLNLSLAGQKVDINVLTTLTFLDRAKMILLSGRADDVSLYIAGTSDVLIGTEAAVMGKLSAPNARVAVASRTQFSGAIHAKRVEFQPDVYTSGTLENAVTVDTDKDGVPDIVEQKAGTDPLSAATKPATAVEGTYLNKTADSLQSVKLNFSYFPGYEQCDAVPMNLDKGSVHGDLIPVPRLIPHSAAGNLPPVDVTYEKDAAVQEIKGTVAPGKKLLYAFPISAQKSGIPKEMLKLYHFNDNTGKWEPVEIAYVTYRAVYAYVTSFSKYLVASKENVYRVNPSFTDNDDLKKYNTIAKAITKIRQFAPSSQCILLLAGSDQTGAGQTETGLIYKEQNLYIPPNVQMLGGFSSTIPDFDQYAIAQPKKFLTILDGEQKTVPIISLNGSGLDKYVSSIEGITIQNSRNSDGALVISSGGHINSIVVRNCVIRNNEGEYAGGMSLFNASKIIVESCIFENNGITPSPNNSFAAGSAVMCYQLASCGVGATFIGCVFYQNTNTNSSIPGGTICNYGTSSIEDPIVYARAIVRVLNCTFFGNSAVNDPNTASCIYKVSDETYRMDIQNCIFTQNTGETFRNCGSNSSGVTISNNLLSNPGFKNSSLPKGSDGIWGTRDDGLQLTSQSVGVVNTGLHSITQNVKENVLELRPSDPGNSSSPLVPTVVEVQNKFRDACGRLRHSTSTFTVDIGAYELYYSVLPIGGANIIGCDNYSFRTKLKSLALAEGYLFDYVGPNTSVPFNSTEAWSIDTDLEEDPNHLVSGMDDNQHFAFTDEERHSMSTTAPKITDAYAGAASFNADLAVMMLGAYDKVYRKAANSTIISEIASLAGLLQGTKVFLTTDVPNGTPEGSGEVENFNQYMFNFPPSTIDADKIISLPYVDENYLTLTNTTGYDNIAASVWTSISNYLESIQ